MFARHYHSVGNQERRIETNTKLTNQITRLNTVFLRILQQNVSKSTSGEIELTFCWRVLVRIQRSIQPISFNKQTCKFDKNSLVPDLAMVPRFLTRSSFVIPIPVSVTCKMLLSLSALILIDISSVAANAALSVKERKRILSNASDAFEINSLRKI